MTYLTYTMGYTDWQGRRYPLLTGVRSPQAHHKMSEFLNDIPTHLWKDVFIQEDASGSFTAFVRNTIR